MARDCNCHQHENDRWKREDHVDEGHGRRLTFAANETDVGAEKAPAANPDPTAMTAMNVETLAPYTSRARVSRDEASVPSQNSRVGPPLLGASPQKP